MRSSSSRLRSPLSSRLRMSACGLASGPRPSRVASRATRARSSSRVTVSPLADSSSQCSASVRDDTKKSLSARLSEGRRDAQVDDSPCSLAGRQSWTDLEQRRAPPPAHHKLRARGLGPRCRGIEPGYEPGAETFAGQRLGVHFVEEAPYYVECLDRVVSSSSLVRAGAHVVPARLTFGGSTNGRVSRVPLASMRTAPPRNSGMRDDAF